MLGNVYFKPFLLTKLKSNNKYTMTLINNYVYVCVCVCVCVCVYIRHIEITSILLCKIIKLKINKEIYIKNTLMY